MSPTKKKEKLYEYDGFLDEYFETGMESLGLILQDKRGIEPNPSYVPGSTKFPFNIPNWHSLNYALFFRGGELLEIYRDDGSIEFRGVVTKDIPTMVKHEYRYSFIPKEIDLLTWIKWVQEGRRAKAWSVTSPIVERMPPC